MSELVTYTQAQRLKKLGFDKQTLSRYIESTGEFVSLYDYQKNDEYRTVVHWLKCPTVSEALDFIREKGIACAVGLNVNHDGKFLGDYIYEFVKENNEVEGLSGFDTHPLAESALLDAVLDYLKKKQTIT